MYLNYYNINYHFSLVLEVILMMHQKNPNVPIIPKKIEVKNL